MSIMVTVGVKSHSVRSACAAARRHLGVKLIDSRVRIKSGGEDGIYRVTLWDGTVVACMIVQRAKTEVLYVEEE
jgi:hypothetical protein